MIKETIGSINLYYRESRSDKVYQVQLDHVDGGYLVNFQFGRRGSSLQSGTKTPTPISYEAARKLYERLIAEKKAKGYTPSETGTPYQSSAQAGEQSTVLPQLLNPIDETETHRLIEDVAWVMQEKKDGIRLLVEKSGDAVRAVNRKGQFVALSKAIECAVRSLNCNALLDGEAIGDVYWVFDLLALRGEDLRPLCVSSRLTALTMLVETSLQSDEIRVIPSAWTPVLKRALFDRLKEERAEGVVFKHVDAKYVPGRPNSGGTHLKFKFTATATCKVLGTNGGKRSVSIAVSQDPGDGFVEIGNVTIPPNYALPEPGALVDVRYLYAYPGGSLYQPVYLGERRDLDCADSAKSLKFKQGEDEES